MKYPKSSLGVETNGPDQYGKSPEKETGLLPRSSYPHWIYKAFARIGAAAFRQQ